MNKAKAYRELQRRQGRIIRRVWTEAPSVAQSYESAAFKQGSSIGSKSAALESRNNLAMLESGNPQINEYGGKIMANGMFNVGSQSTLARSRVSSRQKAIYTEPGRPITAPEANPYATLDGSRQEVMIIPFYPAKANSVRSNSDTQSLNEYNSRRLPGQRKLRQSLDLTQSIDCNNNAPLKPRDQNELVGEVIQYPAASKMREMLATDSSMPMEKSTAVAVDAGNKTMLKRASQVSFASRLSTQAQPSVHNEAYANKTPSNTQPASPSISSTRHQQSRPVSLMQRRANQSKQVSFVDKNEKEKVSIKSVTTADADESQPLALTAKNLNMYNAMILKTIRTAKFDERIVKWVKERQCDQKIRIATHDAIPEVDEASYNESLGRITPNKRDHTGGKTPRESERTIHITSPTVYQSAEPTHSAGQSGQTLAASNVKFMKPTSLDTAKPSVEFSYSIDKKVADSKNQNCDNEKSSDQMSAKTDSNDKAAEPPAT